MRPRYDIVMSKSHRDGAVSYLQDFIINLAPHCGNVGIEKFSYHWRLSRWEVNRFVMGFAIHSPI